MVRSQNPWTGSGCDCDRFCNYECAIFPDPPQNTTVYRMTMEGVYGLANKDTGDIGGDASFVLYQKDQAYKCVSG